jgi:uncharacterized protein (TIGR00255 family)
MALISMTGFGRGEARQDGLKVDVEISSVNRKQFDARVTLPRGLAPLESRMVELIHGAVRRGHVQGSVKVHVADGTRHVRIDVGAAAAVIKELRRAAAALGLPDDLSARSLVSLPDLMLIEGGADDMERLWPLIAEATARALRALRRMEIKEGAALQKDLTARLRKLAARLVRVRARARRVVPAYRQMLRARLAEAGVDLVGDSQGICREIVMFADRCDVSEELTRLASHFAQARALMASREPSGRALDFLCQELFREINTIGSKANDAAIAAHVVHFKAELEAVREQIQNIE